ncbi:putative membrane protein [Kushneria sinocarnis]|uniref:Putative membrane protein n=1 Tax=Kushneria sinocarnis TaxID=595502 RepID=A0A420WYW5_9GAMM|nr:hypothetical protein [Kushneria sinocarnis]RKR06427.1 putative membrane protein [Kushneria sinocarnis]
MINRMNLGIIQFALAFGITFALTRDPWISGLVSLVAPAVHAVAVLANSALWRRLLHPVTAQEPAATACSAEQPCELCPRIRTSPERHPRLHA